jgi:uncharacterized RDD family membrane protein YckC
VTVIEAAPLTPSLVAEIVADPAAMPRTSPAASTVAAELFELDQVIVFPESVLPAASWTVAVSCTVLSTASAALLGDRVTDAADGSVSVTVIEAAPLTPSLVAEIVADPAATPRTSPAASTVAEELFELDQVIVFPESVLPAASWTVAVSCTVLSTASAALLSDRVTDAAEGSTTVTDAVSLCWLALARTITWSVPSLAGV